MIRLQRTAITTLLALSAACGDARQDDDVDPVTGSSALVLDFTAFIDGAVQVSGIGIDRTTGTVAVVTDFERVVLIDAQSVSAIGTFSAQLRTLPRQGSTEAIAFTPDGDIAVLYPDVALLRVYDDDGSGSILGELSLEAVPGPLHGAMALSADGTRLFLIAGADAVRLVEVRLEDGSVVRSTELTGDAITAEVSGLSPGVDGSDARLWAVTGNSRAFSIDVGTGTAEFTGEVSEVEDCSGSEAFVNPEGEAVLAVSDDADRYNSVPGPLRLYLIGD